MNLGLHHLALAAAGLIALGNVTCAHLPFEKHDDARLCKELAHYEKSLDKEDAVYKRMLCDGHQPSCDGLDEEACRAAVGCEPQYPEPSCKNLAPCVVPERVYQGCRAHPQHGRHHFILWLRCDQEYRQMTNCTPRKPRH